MEKTKYIYTIILVLCSLALDTGKAQETEVFSNYMFNELLINPAYTGRSKGLSVSAMLRQNWIGVKGAPSSQVISIHSPLKFKKVSLGLLISNDAIGANYQKKAQVSYAYNIYLAENIISLGLQGAILNYSERFSELDGLDNNDPTFVNKDINNTKYDFGYGACFYSSNFYAGISIPYMISGNERQSTSSISSLMLNTVFINSGICFEITSNFKIEPNVLLKLIKGTPVDVDVNTNIGFYNHFWTGISYRSFSTLEFLAGCKLTRNLKLGYAYGYTRKITSNLFSGSHEIMLNYSLNPANIKYTSPRHL